MSVSHPSHHPLLLSSLWTPFQQVPSYLLFFSKWPPGFNPGYLQEHGGGSHLEHTHLSQVIKGHRKFSKIRDLYIHSVHASECACVCVCMCLWDAPACVTLMWRPEVNVSVFLVMLHLIPWDRVSHWVWRELFAGQGYQQASGICMSPSAPLPSSAGFQACCCIWFSQGH